MQSFVSTIADALHNQLFAGGFVLMSLGALGALARRIPSRLLGWLRRRVIITCDVQSGDEAFSWLQAWLHVHPYTRRARELSVRTINSGDEPKVIFTPAPGNHIFIYGRRLVWLERVRQEPGSDGRSDFWTVARETFKIRVLGRRQEVIRRLIDAARECALRGQRDQVRIYTAQGGCWNSGSELHARPISSVILPAGQLEQIIADVEEFESKRDWYVAMGIPYRRGFLFEGVPGSGKTSVISALAGHLGLQLYVLNLNGDKMDDERLSGLMASVRNNSLILLEDIDAVRASRSRESGEEGGEKDGVTLSGLLNCLDGITAREGCLVFMTTNHAEKLDPALVRPGRVDVRVHFTHATREQSRRMFARFYPEAGRESADSFAERFARRPASMAEIQQHLLRHKGSAEGALSFAPPLSAEAAT